MCTFSSVYVNKAEFDSMLTSHQDLLFLIVQNDELAATWNQLQEYEGRLGMGVIDVQQSPDLVEFLQIADIPQLLYVDQHSRTFIYYEGQWNVEAIKEWLEGEHDHSEEETVIVIEVELPREQEPVQWITDVEEEHHDHHSENWEKKQYDELQQLQTLNDQLYTKTERFKRELEQMNLSLNMLQTSMAIEIHRSEQDIDFSIYLYSSLMIAIVCGVISGCQIKSHKKKKSILIQ